MKHFTLLAILLSSSSLFASFSTTNCSNADATVRYKYNMQWNSPTLEEKWIINGKSYAVNAVVVQTLVAEKDLEVANTNMMMSRSYTKKISIKLPNSAMQPIKTWLTCQSLKGI